MKPWRFRWLAALLLAAANAVAAPVMSVSRAVVDFGNVGIGTVAVQQVVVTNVGDAPLFISGLARIGSGSYALSGPCWDDFSALPPGGGCRLDITLTVSGQVPGPIDARIDLDFDGGPTTSIQLHAFNTGAAAAPDTVAVVEYYNAVLDHYFITWVPAEQANLDAGNTPTRWMRTGLSFRAFTAAQPGSSPVCRYYIPPGLGDSHFFGRGTAECDATGRDHPTLVLESSDFMQVYLPTAGACPAATVQVYRVFSNRPDANHRYMTDRAVRDGMVARGWLAEGDGADLVVMCAPA